MVFHAMITAEALSGILNLRNLRMLDSFNVEHALQLYRRYDVKFIDCLISSIRGIKEGTVPVVSYERDFDRLGIKRIEPAVLLSRS